MSAWIKWITLLPVVSQFLYVYCDFCKRPHGGCSGPYVLEMTSSLTSKICSDVEAELMTRCMSACIQDQCCLSGGIRYNYCQLKNTKDLSVDFIKHVPEEKPQCELGKKSSMQKSFFLFQAIWNVYGFPRSFLLVNYL